jgi:5-methylcytosine-specific restriction endonuclease McrA
MINVIRFRGRYQQKAIGPGPSWPGTSLAQSRQSGGAEAMRYPFTIVLKASVEQPEVHPLRLKLDPGSRTTGIALVDDQSGQVVFAAELSHRGKEIKEALDPRRGVRRRRRARHTRYRQVRFKNRRRPKGWLTPSLMSRVDNVEAWVQRLRRLCPITAISMELVRFDMQAMENSDIEGCAYQQGTLAGYEVRQYLLEKWNRACAHCGKQDVPLQIEHVVARANGGTDRVSNLTLACEPCNQKKGTLDVAVFLRRKPERLKKVLAQAKAPLKDAAAVNSCRWALYERLKEMGLPVECGSGGLTKCNRVQRGLKKTHRGDAACVGRSTPPVLQIGKAIRPLLIKATGHGNRQMCIPDKYGFPKKHRKRAKTFPGYMTGDHVKASTPKGTLEGRIAIRHRPKFHMSQGDVHPKYLRRVQRADGYEYTYEGKGKDPTTLSAEKGGPHSSPA